MDNSGEILCQISSFKDMLDQVNEEIEENIQRTRELESEIVRCSEIENEYLTRERELTKAVSVADFELNSLIQVAGTMRSSVERMKKELTMLKVNRDEVLKRISDKRERFVADCNNFQDNIGNQEKNELKLLFSEKEVLQNEAHNVKMKIDALKHSTGELIADILEDFNIANFALELELQSKTSENVELLNEITELKILMCSIDTG